MRPLKTKGTLQDGNHTIITQLGIDPATYKQRKSDIKNGQASGSVMAFYDSIVEMLGQVFSELYRPNNTNSPLRLLRGSFV